MLPSRRVPCLAVLVAVSLAASGTRAYPATVRYHSDAELIGGSARIVRARVVGSRGERGPRGRIYTVTTVEVLEDFSGYGDPTLEIRELGGTVDDEFLFVGGAVQYQPGSEIVVCLGRAADGSLRSLAMGFSKFDVIRTTADDPILRRNLAETMVVGAAPDGAPRRLGPSVSWLNTCAACDRWFQRAPGRCHRRRTGRQSRSRSSILATAGAVAGPKRTVARP